jgi:Protein-tyrosine-phosphatase
MAEAFGKVLGLEVFECFSAGTERSGQINQDAVRIMKETGIDMELHQKPKLLEDIPAVDIAVTMGCNVNCPVIACRHREDWGLEDPTGKSDEEFRSVRNAIKTKIEDLTHRIKTGLLG